MGVRTLPTTGKGSTNKTLRPVVGMDELVGNAAQEENSP
jgi:hypothetical protein